MARLPFNPDKIPDPPASTGARAPSAADTSGGVSGATSGATSGGGGDRPITVTQAARLVKDALIQALPRRLRIVGQVSNFTQRSHWYFSLKDSAAALRCVCFASAARRVPFTPEDGMEVVVTGRFDYYDARGDLQIYVDKIEPVGAGALEIAFRALCEQLRSLGYFDESRKKPLPPFPQRVAVVTSRTAAALHDVVNTASRRWPGCRLLLMDVRVQGAQAAPEIAAAIDALSRDGERLGIDAVILTRGGGSIEDLWAFNERAVADALFRCRLPVIAAIGHETDTTVAELVADLRASTPTQAAMTLIPDRAAVEHQVRQMSQRLGLLVKRELDQSRQRLAAAARHPFFRKPVNMLAPAADRLNRLDERLHTALARRVENGHTKLTSLAKHLEAVGPAKVLARGYTYTLGPDGKLLRSAATARLGDTLTTVLADGQVRSQVEGGASGPIQPSPTSPRPKRASLLKPATSSDPGLFENA